MAVGGSSSQQTQRQDSFIDPTQAGFLGQMWQQAMGAGDPLATQEAARRASQMTTPQIGAALGNTTALTDASSQISAQAQSLQSGLGQLFREEINPAISSNAIAAGGFGGGRQGVAQGVATGQLGQAYTQGLGDIVANANRTALGAAGLVPGLSSAMYQSEVNPTLAGYDPLSRLASILGSPTVLNRQRGQSSSGSFSLGLPFG